MSWQQGTCNCCGNCEVCCCGTWCLPCLQCRTASSLGRCGFGYFLLGLVLPCCSAFCLRREARARYSIPGNCCEDLCCSCACYPCVSCQTEVEVKTRGSLPPQPVVVQVINTDVPRK